MDKISNDCSTGEATELTFTADELAKISYLASLPPVILPKTEIEIMKDTQSQVVLALVTGGLM